MSVRTQDVSKKYGGRRALCGAFCTSRIGTRMSLRLFFFHFFPQKEPSACGYHAGHRFQAEVARVFHYETFYLRKVPRQTSILSPGHQRRGYQQKRSLFRHAISRSRRQQSMKLLSYRVLSRSQPGTVFAPDNHFQISAAPCIPQMFSYRLSLSDRRHEITYVSTCSYEPTCEGR